MTTPKLELQGVSKAFDDKPVLRDVDLVVAPHEVVCLIGSSGSGKSTMLKCVNLLVPIDEGRILLDGADIEKEARLLRAAEKAGVVMPHILADDTKTGTIISEYVEGESIPRKILRLVEAQSGLGSRLTSDCGTALAMIHRIPIQDFQDLHDLSNSDRYANEMEQLLESLSTPHPASSSGRTTLA